MWIINFEQHNSTMIHLSYSRFMTHFNWFTSISSALQFHIYSLSSAHQVQLGRSGQINVGSGGRNRNSEPLLASLVRRVASTTQLLLAEFFHSNIYSSHLETTSSFKTRLIKNKRKVLYSLSKTKWNEREKSCAKEYPVIKSCAIKLELLCE